MNLSGQRKGFFTRAFPAAALTAAMLLSGCNYTMVSTEDLLQLMQMNAEAAPEQTEEPELQTPADTSQSERLENQLLSVLNLSQPESPVTSDSALDDAASFFMDLILTGEQSYAEMEDSLKDYDALLNQNIHVLIYDGATASAQVGDSVLKKISAISAENENQSFCLSSLSVNFGQSGSRSAWLILLQYTSL